MTWAKFSDDTWRRRDIRALSDAACRVWSMSIIYSCDQLTDGELTAADLDEICLRRHRPKKIADELVGAGLWEATDNGWRIVDFFEDQPSREQVEAQREKEREKKRLQRELKRLRDLEAAEKARDQADSLRTSRTVSPGDNPRDTLGESPPWSPGLSEAPDPTRPDSGSNPVVGNTLASPDRVPDIEEQHQAAGQW